MLSWKLSWETVLRYTVSTLVTFFAGVAIVIVPALDNLTLEQVQQGALVGLLFSGARLGFKMVLEGFLALYNSGK